MTLSNLHKIIGNKRPSKRIGRGGGSGKGFHTVGKGNKGQNARSGHGIPVGFEGGQVPLYKKLPKIRGFNRSYKKRPAVVNFARLTVFDAGTEITPQALLAKRIINKNDIKKGVKILAHGELKKEFTFSGVLFSKSAAKKCLKRK
ncbi:50S ribosomal protein L15 [candidate division WWE3 bacterium CG08_land_8_20_14_0_20_41_10]|uniref:Large ribosomal subunit protein uL15 n=1 Tax=candidate division WWE3 bacterium CG08_land_8_20_14_0_20_41_10 TaxID=1975085 RepID=A0A2H0XDI7_UNCKA|nr:MAG: 50S ribosomal protein L15 [candidate division WWE3 bacterium CG08_land_8_20_14_0_20_41_10]